MELLQNTAATLRFPEDGGDAVTFAAAPKVTVTRDSDGTAVIEDVEATEVGKGAYWTVTLTPAQTAEVDLLSIEWTGEVGGASNTYTTYAEVVGGFVVSLAAIEDKLGEEETEANCRAKREVALRSIEQACGVAFRPRYAKVRLNGSGAKRLMLRHPRLLRVLSVEIEYTDETKTLTAEELEELTLDPLGMLTRSTKWPEGQGNIVVAYVHGHTYFPEAVEPVRDYAAYLLIESPMDSDARATSVATEVGTYSLVTPGVRGATFPLPAVNAFVQQHHYPTVG